MKSFPRSAFFLLLVALAAGCATTGNRSEHEEFLGTREQKSLLAKARPLQEFGFSPSFPFGTGMLYFGATLLEPNQTAAKTFAPGGMPVIEIQGDSPRKKLRVLLHTSSHTSWMQYSCAAKNDITFLRHNGGVIPYIGSAIPQGATFAGVIPLLQIDGLTLNNTPFYIRMAKGTMEPVVYNSTVPRVDAVLGYDNLRQFQFIQFDLQKGIVRFSTSTPYTPNEKILTGQAILSTVCRDCLAVQGSVFGQPVPIVLDFVGNYAFARGDTRDPVTKQVELGEVVFLNEPNEVLSAQDTYPRAGRKMLEKYVVTICPRQGVVYFERPAE